MADAPVVVATFFTRTEAELAAARLRAFGIDSMVRMDDGGGTYPGLNFGRADVLVRPDLEAEARRALEEPG